MAKINATYSSGYYLAPDTDYRKLEEEQQRSRKRERHESRQQQQGVGEIKSAIRQTFAIPFNIICLHCNRRIARGTHGYVNRRATEEKYMGIRIWELEFRCIFCKGHIYLKTDYETAKLTGGYHCSRNCRRGEGDFYGTNQINEEVRVLQAAEEAEKGTLEALERENEAMRALQERERLIEELVESRAGTFEEDTRDELLITIQTRERQRQHQKHEEQEQAQSDERASLEKQSAEEEEAYRRFETQLRFWREETERQQSKDDAKEETRVAAVITARYSTTAAAAAAAAATALSTPAPLQASPLPASPSLTTSTTMGKRETTKPEKQRNVFMNDSDSDSDSRDVALVENGRVMSKVVSNTSTGGTTVSTTIPASKRRKGGVLRSLLDE